MIGNIVPIKGGGKIEKIFDVDWENGDSNPSISSHLTAMKTYDFLMFEWYMIKPNDTGYVQVSPFGTIVPKEVYDNTTDVFYVQLINADDIASLVSKIAVNVGHGNGIIEIELPQGSSFDRIIHINCYGINA